MIHITQLYQEPQWRAEAHDRLLTELIAIARVDRAEQRVTYRKSHLPDSSGAV